MNYYNKELACLPGYIINDMNSSHDDGWITFDYLVFKPYFLSCHRIMGASSYLISMDWSLFHLFKVPVNDFYSYFLIDWNNLFCRFIEYLQQRYLILPNAYMAAFQSEFIQFFWNRYQKRYTLQLNMKFCFLFRAGSCASVLEA